MDLVICAKHYFRFSLPCIETSPESSVGKPVCSPSTDSPATKSTKRTHFTPQQIYKLEQFFLKNQFPTAKDRENLAKELQLSAKHIQVKKTYIIQCTHNYNLFYSQRALNK